MSRPVNRFFIAGCQRSGTTLLRLALECHPDIACFDEWRAYPALASGEVALPPGKSLAGFKIPRWTETLTEPESWDVLQGTRARDVYRGEPVVFMIRDVRDTIASMQKLNAGGTMSWLDEYARPTVKQKIEDDPATARRFAPELEMVRAGGYASHLVGALYWKFKTLTYFDLRERCLPVLVVRYEQLVRHPKRQMKRVLRFLKVPWNAGVLRHPEFAHGDLDASGRAIGNTDPARAIDASSVGHYVHFLSRAQEAEVMAVAGDLNRRVVVECSGGPASRLTRRLWLALAG